MTREIILNELQSYQALLARIRGLDQEMDDLRERATSLGNSIGDGLPHGIGEADAKYANIINMLRDAELEQAKELMQLQDTKQKVINIINLAPTKKGRDILELRYRYGYSVKQISQDLKKSDTNIRAVQNRAINHISKITG